MNDLDAQQLVDSSLSHSEFVKQLSGYLSVSDSTIYEWVGDKFKTIENKRDILVFKLSLLGRTQQEIADAVVRAGYEKEYDRSSVSRILCKFPDLEKLTKLLFQDGEGKSISEIVEENGEKYAIDEILAWAIVLEDKHDVDKLELLNEKIDGLSCKPRPYDCWTFLSPHDLFSYEYPGRTPGQMLLQLLYFYTKQGDLVVDPMAGSGTMVDVCLLMNRKCLSYDISSDACKERMEHQELDAISAIGNLKKKASLIFLDPPYYKKKAKEYGEKSISNLSKTEYLKYFKDLAVTCKNHLISDGKLALLMSDYTEDDPSESIFTHHYIKLFEERGFIVERVILCPLSTEQIHPGFIVKYSEARKLCNLARHLVIFREAEPR